MQIPTEILAIIGNLGVGGIFLWLYLVEKKERQEANGKKDELHDKVLEAFSKNTLAQEKVNNALDRNAEMTKSLSDLVYDVLKEKRQ